MPKPAVRSQYRHVGRCAGFARSIGAGGALAVALAVSAPSAHALQAAACSRATLDFGNGPPSPAALPASMGATSSSRAWLTTSPASAGWRSAGRDHTTQDTTGTGYFLLLDSTNGLPADTPVYSLPLTGLTPGQSYTVGLWVTSVYERNPPVIRARLLNGVAELATSTPTLTSVTDNAAPKLPWQQITWTFIAPAADLTLQVLDRGHPALDGFDLGIDDITIDNACGAPGVSAVPVGGEGMLAALSASVLGAVAISRRRRRGTGV